MPLLAPVSAVASGVGAGVFAAPVGAAVGDGEALEPHAAARIAKVPSRANMALGADLVVLMIFDSSLGDLLRSPPHLEA